MQVQRWISFTCEFRLVVISSAFFLFLLRKHFITKKKFKKCGEAKDSVIFPFLFCFIRELNLYPPCAASAHHALQT